MFHQYIHQGLKPFGSGFIFTENFSARLLDVIFQVEVIQVDVVYDIVKLQLIANPWSTIDIRYRLFRLFQLDGRCQCAQQTPRYFTIATSGYHKSMRLGLVVRNHDSCFFVLLIRAGSRSRQRAALLAATTAFEFDRGATLGLFSLCNDWYLDSVAADINASSQWLLLAIRLIWRFRVAGG
jgi:hypothetical protein